MKLLLLTLVAVLGAARAKLDNELLQKYDFDILFSRDDLRKTYFDCVLDRAPCDNEHQKLKESATEAVQTNCAECTPEVKEKYTRLNEKFQKAYPTEYNEFLSKVLSKKQ